MRVFLRAIANVVIFTILPSWEKKFKKVLGETKLAGRD